MFFWPENLHPAPLLEAGEGEEWSIPPAPPSPEGRPPSAVSRDLFYAGMRRVGAAVSIVTTAGPAGRCGFTASAICSVTDDPPTLLVCMNRRSALNPVFKRNGIFCVNTLAFAQESIANCFAGLDGISMAERFRRAHWTVLATGAPALDGCLVSFDCRIVDVKEVGTHSVMFGMIAAIALQEPERHALVYLDKNYHGVALAAR